MALAVAIQHFIWLPDRHCAFAVTMRYNLGVASAEVGPMFQEIDV